MNHLVAVTKMVGLLLVLPLAAQIATENLPLRLEAPHSAEDYQWSLGGRVIPGATNQVLEIPSAQEADAGTYRVESSTGHSALFKVRFQRNVRVQVNGVDVRGDRVSIRGPSQIRLSSPLGPLPIRYTLDGTEPTAASQLYRTPVLVTNSCLLRAAIVIPEGDSIQIVR
jgi:hypothetical protein